MSKNYKDYCREAVKRDPQIYGSMFNHDGSPKKIPKMSNMCKKKTPQDVPTDYLAPLQRDGWQPFSLDEPSTKPPELEVTGTEIKLKGRIQNLIIQKLPDKKDKKEYNRIWMQNDRVRKKLKMLKEKYGVTTKI